MSATSFATWFLDNGIGVFPIKTRSKEPACRSWDDFKCTREQAKEFENYGVILSDTLGVIDTDDPLAELWVKDRILDGSIPETPFIVQGARGKHRYYRLLRDTPKFIHRDGFVIEFRNSGQYVVGPGSIHPTGIEYLADPWSGQLLDIPVFPEFQFDDRPGQATGVLGAEAFVFPEAVFAGERHDMLYKQLRSWKALGNDRTSGWELIKLANERCVPPIRESELLRWFNRGWDTPDRPIERILPKLSSLGVGEL